MWVLANVYTRNDYGPANAPGSCTLDQINARRLVVSLHGAAIYLQTRFSAMPGDMGDWSVETLYVPGRYIFTAGARPFHGVRARSAVLGQAALVTLEAFGPGEG